MTYVSQTVQANTKSIYRQGAFVTLPGGTRFRLTTPYSREDVSIPDDIGAYSAQCYIGPPLWRTHWDVMDQGREIGNIVENPNHVIGISIPQNSRNEAITKALTKIADQKVNLGENLATLGQTVRLFTLRSSILLDALRAARKVRAWKQFLKKSRDTLRREGIDSVAAREYLAYVYGLKPLMQDVFGAAQTMKALAKKDLLFKGVGKSTTLRGATTGFRNLSYSQLERIGGTATAKVKCTLWARIDPETPSLRAMNQLGLLNPAGLLWDLVPYSFVVDWFIPVGPVLYALTARAGLIFVDGSLSMRVTENIQFRYIVYTTGFYYPNRDPTLPGNETKLVFTRTYDGFVRENITSWPLPGFYFDSDPFRGDRPYKALALGILGLSRYR